MNKFEKQLERWNKGVLRGAQAKLAKQLNVSTATTALWATGKRRPSKGYVAQMARLFGLDIYQVVKLFETPASVTYPTPAVAQHLLRDGDLRPDYSSDSVGNENTPHQSNSVSVPFLNKVPLHYPVLDEDDILEWWNIPRRYAQGVKYIVRAQDIGLPGALSETDLCFVKPCTLPDHGQNVLLADTQSHFCVCRAVRRTNNLSYQNLSGKRIKNIVDYTVLGVILYRIKSF